MEATRGAASAAERHALLALLRTRPHGLKVAEITTKILDSGSASHVWENLSAAQLDLLASTDLVTCSDPVASAKADIAAWEAAGHRFVTVLDPDYPQRLLDIRETPPFLFAHGQLDPDDLGMSVVGSRDASDRGLRIADAVARLLVHEGLTVISGLAKGVDTAAHSAAISEGGRTVAFIGNGLEHTYPAENRKLQAAVADTGLVLSQFWPDERPRKDTFLKRNTLMSGYGLATIVVEAGEKSGTRWQVRDAVGHGRPVILTDTVATATSWGRELADAPGVHVVSGMDQVVHAIRQIVAEQSAPKLTTPKLALF